MQSLLFAEYTKILETGELSDIEITVGKEPNTKTYRLHSFILKVCSPYFRELLSKKQQIKIENGIKIANKNISVKAFEILIKYIYSDKLKLENNDFKINVDLLVAAYALRLNELCSFIENHLLMNEELLKQNFVLIQTVADRHKFTKLSKYYKSAYQQDPSLFFKANDFTDISKEFLLHILTKDNLSLKPIEVWNKIIEWAIVQSNNELPSEITKWTTDNILDYELACILTKYIKYYIENYNFADFFVSNVNFYKLKLLVRGSENGFDRRNFHERCDNKGPTITIVKVKDTNEILGGYNPCDWKYGCYGNKIRGSLIFSLSKVNPSTFGEVDDSSLLSTYTVEPLRANFVYFSSTINSLLEYMNSGPEFGSDLKLLLNNTNRGQYCKNNYSEKIRQIEAEFEIEEYEVFQITKNSN
ncbi:BTB/POZ domain-containing protein [Rhizophagus diaphanus]|nr:BTB/POZ domain-containing protein [Rhizophagus diaphanus] [Rhizophagus sp. MUCL 43196]